MRQKQTWVVLPPGLSRWCTSCSSHTGCQTWRGSPSHSRGFHPWEENTTRADRWARVSLDVTSSWGQLIVLFLAIQTSTINTDHLQVSDINFVIVIKPHFSTYLLMYSALSTLLQTLHLKQPRCQCLSSATRDCSFLNSFPQPQQSEQRGEDWMKESERVDASRPDLMNVMTEIPRLWKDFWLCGGFGCVIDAVQSCRLERRGTDCGQPVWVLGCWQGEAGYTFGRRTPSRWKSLGRRLGTAVCKQTQNTGSHLVSSRLPSGFYFVLNHIFVFWKLVFFNAKNNVLICTSTECWWPFLRSFFFWFSSKTHFDRKWHFELTASSLGH